MEFEVNASLGTFKALVERQNRAWIERKRAENNPVWIGLAVFGGVLLPRSGGGGGALFAVCGADPACFVDVLSLPENRLSVKAPDDPGSWGQMAGDFWADFQRELGRLGLIAPVLPAKPKPAEPGNPAGLDPWFVYYHAMKDAGQRYTLGDLAAENSLSKSYVKHQHAFWLAENG